MALQGMGVSTFWGFTPAIDLQNAPPAARSAGKRKVKRVCRTADLSSHYKKFSFNHCMFITDGYNAAHSAATT